MDDLISRQDAIDALKMDISIIPFAKAREYVRAAIDEIYNRLEELPSATETHDKRTETHACDYISRQAAINAIENTDCELSTDAWNELTDAIMSLPSAQRKGKWIEEWEMGWSECPFCGESYLWEDFKGVGEWNFCPNCGAEMKGEEDETD